MDQERVKWMKIIEGAKQPWGCVIGGPGIHHLHRPSDPPHDRRLGSTEWTCQDHQELPQQA